ncbi:hypothetical protein IAT40_007546 [Kwoniella sp. CBS 6097]
MSSSQVKQSASTVPTASASSTMPASSSPPVPTSAPPPASTESTAAPFTFGPAPPAVGPAPDIPGSIFRHVPTLDEKNATTLLPKHVSQLITGIATSTRMSLRVSAFLVEAILESSRYSTKLSLGYTRQMLISAIWAARGMYHLTNEELNLNPLEILASSIFPTDSEMDKNIDKDGETGANTDAFLSIFNKYTNLGVYLIHHTFTLAELFSMSGFFITTGAIKTVHQAASESVAIFDGLFGSSESSRALSAIITMVRREVLHDERRGKMGVLASLTGLTKALTAFACLQAATWQRTSKRLKLKVLYDCTILAEEVNVYTMSQRRLDAQVSVHTITSGPSSNAPANAPASVPVLQTPPATATLPGSKAPQEVGIIAQPEAKPSSLAAMDAPKDTGGPGPSTMQARRNHDVSGYHSAPSLDEANQRLVAPLGLRSSDTITASLEANFTGDEDDKFDWSMDDLDEIVGESGDEIYGGPPNEVSREEHRQARKLEITDELRQSTVVSQMLYQIRNDGIRYRTAPLHRRQLSLPEFTSRLIQRVDTDDDDPMSEIEVSSATSCTNSPRPRSAFSMLSGMEENREDENDWIEVDQLLEDDAHQKALPVDQSIGSNAYLDALEHPQHNMERIKLVLQTVTHKFEQRKRTIRHLREEARGGSTSPHEDIIMISESRGGDRSGGQSSSSQVRPVDWDGTLRARVDSHGNSRARTSSSTPRLRAGSLSRSISNPALSRSSISPLTPAFTNSTPISPRSSRDTGTSTPNAIGPRHTSASPLRRRRPPPISLTPHSEALAAGVGVKAPPPSPCDSLMLPQLVTAIATTASVQGTDQNQREASISPMQPVATRTLAAPSPAAPGTTGQSPATQVQAQSVVSRSIPPGEAGSPNNLFPHEGLIRNIHRFMKFSSAAYGQNFLRILGMGQPEGPFPHLTKRGKHHANSWSFAEHVNIPIDCILLSSFTESSATLSKQEAPPLIHYVAIIHEAKAIALTCRGTLGLSDLLVDLTCEYESIDVDEGDRDAHYYVHSGMWQSARKLTVKQSTVHEVLLNALTKYPEYGLVLAGHSLGGGVASLLGILCSMPAKSFLEQNTALKQPFVHPAITTPFVTNITSGLPPGRPIHVYAYGPPAVASPDLAAYASGLITSVIQDTDIVPTLSLGGVKDFKNISLTLSEEGNIAEEIVGRVIGAGAKKRKAMQQQAAQSQGGVAVAGADTGATPAAMTEDAKEAEELSDWMVSLIKTMRADMDNDKLYPAGTVYIMEHFDVVVKNSVYPYRRPGGPACQLDQKTISKQAHRVILRQCDSVVERFREPMFSRMMLQNHLPTQYERSTHLLYEGLGQGKIR